MQLKVFVGGIRRREPKQAGMTFAEILIVTGVVAVLGIAAFVVFTQLGQNTERNTLAAQLAEQVAQQNRLMQSNLRRSEMNAAEIAAKWGTLIADHPTLLPTSGTPPPPVTATANVAACTGTPTNGAGIQIVSGNTTDASPIETQAEAQDFQTAIISQLRDLVPTAEWGEIIDDHGGGTTAQTALNASAAATRPTGTMPATINICIDNA